MEGEELLARGHIPLPNRFDASPSLKIKLLKLNYSTSQLVGLGNAVHVFLVPSQTQSQ